MSDSHGRVHSVRWSCSGTRSRPPSVARRRLQAAPRFCARDRFRPKAASTAAGPKRTFFRRGMGVPSPPGGVPSRIPRTQHAASHPNSINRGNHINKTLAQEPDEGPVSHLREFLGAGSTAAGAADASPCVYRIRVPYTQPCTSWCAIHIISLGGCGGVGPPLRFFCFRLGF